MRRQARRGSGECDGGSKKKWPHASPQTSRAVSTMRSNFRHCSSCDSVTSLPKPHCGLSASCAERQIFGRIIDPAAQFIDRLDVGALGRDEAEHGDLVLGHEAQRREAAGALAVVFEQQPVVPQPVEQPLGNGVVMAFAVPLRHHLAGRRVDGSRIAAADVDAECHAVEAGDHRVVGVDRAREIGVGVFAARSHAFERDLVDIGGIAGRVDLDVAAAGLDQAAI